MRPLVAGNDLFTVGYCTHIGMSRRSNARSLPPTWRRLLHVGGRSPIRRLPILGVVDYGQRG